MSTRGIFHGFARGRAIVRNRAMREARRWQRLLANGSSEAMRLAVMNARPKGRAKRHGLTRGEYYMLSADGLREIVRNNVAREVRRARRAHQDWRKYRATDAAIECCFACGRRLGANPNLADTRDHQTVFVGVECLRKITAAGNAGWQPPKGGPRLYPMGA